jgi:hypothetical protein
MVFDIHVAGPDDAALVRRVYQILQQKFAADELDPVEETLAIAAGEDPLCRMVMAVAFHAGTLSSSGEKAIAGLCIWEYFVVPQCYLFTYFWVDESLNGRGLGLQLGLRCWDEAVKRTNYPPGPRGECVPASERTRTLAAVHDALLEMLWRQQWPRRS